MLYCHCCFEKYEGSQEDGEVRFMEEAKVDGDLSYFYNVQWLGK